MSDAINKPAHYNQGLIECIEAMKIVLTPEEFRGYLKGNVFKYLWREKDKNGIEDLRKGKSYYDLLIELVDESEQQKAADLQSLKDHPFGKLKEPVAKESLTAKPDPGEGYRLLSKDPPEKLLDTDEGFFACGLDGQQWLSVNYSSGEQLPSVYYRRKIKPAEQPKVTGHFDDTEGVWVDEKSPFDGRRNSDTIPEGYRKLNDSSEEPRQLGDLRWSVSEKRYVEISVDEIGYANRDNWAACRKVEPAIKQPSTPEPPDGWRWLKVGETLCRGDTTNTIDGIPEDWIGIKCAVKHNLLRRNRFKVGEKVVRVRDPRGIVFQVKFVLAGNFYRLETEGGLPDRLHGKDLAPYIEETK